MKSGKENENGKLGFFRKSLFFLFPAAVNDEKKIEASINTFKKNNKASFVFGDLFMMRNNNITYKIIGDPQYISKIKYKMPRINHPTVMAKKDIYAKYGLFNLSFSIAMDYEWLLRITHNQSIGYYSSSICVYMSEGGVSEDIFEALRQERDVSIFHGLNPVVGFIIYFTRSCLLYTSPSPRD